MGKLFQEMDFTARLAEERPRLVRLCEWLTGDAEAAEDLAQESLLAAWRNQSQLSAPEKLKPWLSAIARSAYRNWSRKKYREQAHLVKPTDMLEDTPEDELQDEVSLESELDQAELSRLLGQAMALLPGQTAQMLVEHYIRESSHVEIAQKMGMKAGTVAVRLQRGKLTLRRLLRTHLQDEALAFGLAPQESAAWEETNIWCPRCGKSRLLGQFHKDTPNARFVLRCPHCHPDPQTVMVRYDLTRPYYAGLLGSTKTYKPAYSRLLAGLAPFYQQALSTHTSACLECGRPVVVHRTHGKKTAHLSSQGNIEILIHCSSCDWATNTNLTGLMLALPDAQRFWRENPRLITFPPEEIEIQGLLAYVTRMQSLSGAAELAVISRRDTLAFIGVHTNVRL